LRPHSRVQVLFAQDWRVAFLRYAEHFLYLLASEYGFSDGCISILTTFCC
jgi:hypothetical protein